MRRAVTLSAALAVAALACGDSGPATATDRLWICELPTNPRAEITAFLVTSVRGDRYVGAFWQGTVFRGGYDLFEWEAIGDGRANVHFFQDDSESQVRFETCAPTTGFDHCIELHGDPKGKVRYQSRKRWRVRGGKRSAAELSTTLAQLADVDEDLAALIDPQLLRDTEE